MADVSHTHPHADRGAVNRPFERGRTVVADGGRRGERRDDRPESEGDERDASADETERSEAEDDDQERVDDRDRMRDVDHTPPDENRDVNRVFERGGTEEPVESEE